MGSRQVGLPVRIPAGWHGGTRIGPGSGILGPNAEEEASTRPPAPLADPISENGKNPEIRLPRPIGTECSAVVLGVKVRQEPSSVSLHPPKPRPPDAGIGVVDRGPQATGSVRPRHFGGANHGSLRTAYAGSIASGRV